MAIDDPYDDLTLPWCEALDADSTWTRYPSDSFFKKSTTQNSLTAETLRTRQGIRAMRVYVKYNNSDSTPDGAKAVEEVRLLVSVGTGVNGGENRMHGGFTAMLLDEVTGEVANHKASPGTIATASLKVNYHRMIQPPVVLLCRAWFKERSTGRKVQTIGTIEDGMGGVYASGEALLIRLGQKL